MDAGAMTPHYADDWLTIYGGDCREVLASLPADSVDCVVTSPPYWGLRDYGTATWEGGDAECDHKPTIRPRSERPNVTGAGIGKSDYVGQLPAFRESCGKCGAVRIDSQLGLERTPEEYVANMVAVFAEVRRVLKPSGTCWLNLGDSYTSGGRETQVRDTFRDAASGKHANLNGIAVRPANAPGLKPKDLVGIPWRVAFALQADGWYLRSDIIWSKPNPMPESVTDRPTKAHEYLFLLTKSARYYFDADAVREDRDPKQIEWREKYGETVGEWGKRREAGLGRPGANSGLATQANTAGRNIRSVWNIATRPYPGAHFAVFPPELPERCIKAGSSERGVCPQCGVPWERVVERPANPFPGSSHTHGRDAEQGNTQIHASGVSAGTVAYWRHKQRGSGGTTTGWRRTCKHMDLREYLQPVPAVVLDPFAGSGTVGMVANRLSRRAILIDLNPAYLKQQMRRNIAIPLGL